MGDKSAQKQIRTVLRRHASGRADDSTFHHDDHQPHMKAPKSEVSAAERRRLAQIRKAGEKKSTKEILKAAANRALGGGLPGAAAMGIQVCSLMWMRTTMNYQYRHGSGTVAALKHLYGEGPSHQKSIYTERARESESAAAKAKARTISRIVRRFPTLYPGFSLLLHCCALGAPPRFVRFV